MKKLINQIWKFGIVGVICTVIDFGILTFLGRWQASIILYPMRCPFTVSVVANYVLSMKYVFRRKKNANRVKEFIVFVILSAIGLLFKSASYVGRCGRNGNLLCGGQGSGYRCCNGIQFCFQKTDSGRKKSRRNRK